jgi:hypothetical protein
LAKKIADEFGFVMISADAIKETIWDQMGYESDLDLSVKISKAAFELLFNFVGSALSKDVSLVIEAHFHPELDNERINMHKEKYDFNLVQIHCDCETENLKKRFQERMEKGPYHNGHKHVVGLYGLDRILNSLGTKNKRLTIDGETLDLDTTDFGSVDYEKIFRFIRESIK